MSKIIAIALREYKVTALTKGFIIGTFILPLVIWGLIILVTAAGIFNTKKPPMSGVLAVVDTTFESRVLDAFRAEFTPEMRTQRRREASADFQRLMRDNPASQVLGVTPEQLEIASTMTPASRPPDVTIEQITPDQLDSAKARLQEGKILAIIEIGPHSLQLPPSALSEPAESDGSATTQVAEAAGSEASAAPAPPAEADAPRPNSYRVIHNPTLDPEYVKLIRQSAVNAIQDTRYRAAGMDPNLVRILTANEPWGRTSVVTESGNEEKSNEIIAEILPFVFLMLLFIAAVTSGQYLLMSTLEEKSSRVMEVLLSAASPMHLMVGKLLGQALVGLTILAIYSALGIAAADRFQVLSQIPVAQIPWLVIYFIIAYGLMASLNIAVGAAVNELRDTQALYPPITMLMIVPFVLMIPVTNNPAGWVSKVFSWIPFTTPYVMVMRLSQPSHHVPLWELVATTIVGFLGVAFLVWAASKVFRIGVLMYGKPPSLMGLLKWVRAG